MAQSFCCRCYRLLALSLRITATPCSCTREICSETVARPNSSGAFHAFEHEVVADAMGEIAVTTLDFSQPPRYTLLCLSNGTRLAEIISPAAHHELRVPEVTPNSPLDRYRSQLDRLDSRIVEMIARRLTICENVARYKKSERIPMMQSERVELVKQTVAAKAKANGIDEQFIRKLYALMIEEACRLEDAIIESQAESASATVVDGAGAIEIGVRFPSPAGENMGDRTDKAWLNHSAVVLGVNGVVGRAFAGKLVESGMSVAGLDLHETVFDEGVGIAFQQSDAVAPTPAGRELIRRADIVLLCLPENTAIAALPAVVQAAASDSLIVDTLSVKEKIVARLDALRPTQEWLSINPLFSPRLGFAGQNVAIVKVKSGPRTIEFESLLTSWGAATVDVLAAEHDRITALVQVATHATLISLGLTLHDWSYDVTRAMRMATPPHRLCLALLARMSDASPEVYWDIQRSNAYGGRARQSLLKSMEDLSEAVTSGSDQQFKELMKRIGRVVEPLREALLGCANVASEASVLPGSVTGPERTAVKTRGRGSCIANRER